MVGIARIFVSKAMRLQVDIWTDGTRICCNEVKIGMQPLRNSIPTNETVTQFSAQTLG